MKTKQKNMVKGNQPIIQEKIKQKTNENVMSERLDIDNPFYDNDASASAFGWDFQINAAIFLFLKYLENIEIKKLKKRKTIKKHVGIN